MVVAIDSDDQKPLSDGCLNQAVHGVVSDDNVIKRYVGVAFAPARCRFEKPPAGFVKMCPVAAAGPVEERWYAHRRSHRHSVAAGVLERELQHRLRCRTTVDPSNNATLIRRWNVAEHDNWAHRTRHDAGRHGPEQHEAIAAAVPVSDHDQAGTAALIAEHIRGVAFDGAPFHHSLRSRSPDLSHVVAHQLLVAVPRVPLLVCHLVVGQQVRVVQVQFVRGYEPYRNIPAPPFADRPIHGRGRPCGAIESDHDRNAGCVHDHHLVVTRPEKPDRQ